MYSGSCHCGRISFEVDGEFSEVKECNCSQHVINHHFCPNCGCAPLATGRGPSGAATAAVNVRCLEGVDLTTIKRVPVDGRSR